MRKKVLIITYYWPPAGGPGVQRAVYFVKYLRNFGWEPIVYTVKDGEYPNLDRSFEKEIPEDLTVWKRRSPEPYYWYKLLTGRKKDESLKPAIVSETSKKSLAHQIAVWIRGNFFIPDARMWWIRPSVRFLRRKLQDEPVDAIFSTSPPQSVHLIAQGVARKMNIPWIADFRDPWTKVHYFDKLMLTPFAEKKHKKQEKEVLKNATQVIATSWTTAADFEKISNRDVQVLTNGFELPDSIPELSLRNNDTFKVLYLGSMTIKKNPELFWIELKKWIDQSSISPENLDFIFLGNVESSIFEHLDEIGLQKYYSKIPYIPHNEIWMEMAKADLLFLIGVPDSPDIIPAKIYEYLAVRRPIFSISTKGGDIEKLLKITGAGWNADFNDPKMMFSNFKKMYELHHQNKLQESFKTKNEVLTKFTRENLAGKLAEILDEVIEK